jgi:carbonic anhydrase
MRKLLAGIHRFHKQYWSENKELFERLAAQGQE